MLLTGNKEPPKHCSEVQRLVNSFGQDLVFRVTCGQVKTPKHVLLPHAVKTLTNNVELIPIINQCGMSFSKIEEINTGHCLQKLASMPENSVPLPESIKLCISTILACDNINHLEKILSGEGTLHPVNGITTQVRLFGADLPFHGCDSHPVKVEETKY